MRVLIIGAGLYGSLIGAALIESGSDVTFLVGKSRQNQLIGRGLYVSSPFGRFAKPVHAVTSLAEGVPFDVVVVASRAHVYQLGLFFAEHAIGPDTIVFPVFDGAHHLDYWAESFPGNPIALASFNIRATKDADGHVHQSRPCGDLAVGAGSANDAQLKPLVAALNGRRFTARLATDTIVAEIWAKHIYSSAAVATAHLEKMSLRDSLRFGRRDLFEQMRKEGLAVGEAHGIKAVRMYADRYRTGFQRESVPIQIPTPIAAGGNGGAEAAALLAFLVALSQHAKVRVPWLLHACKCQS